MSRMFSSKSSGGGVVVVRRAMSVIVPRATPAMPNARRVARAGSSAPGPGRRGSGGGEAAVYADELAGEVGAGGAGEEDGDAFEVGGVAVAADHGAGGQGGGAGRVGGDLGGEGSGDEAGGDGIAADAVPGPGFGLGAGEREEAAFGGAVAAAVGECPDGLLGGDVDDPAPA